MSVLEIIIYILLAIGIFFIFAGVIGVIRMPDTFCRLQSSTNIATMGAMPIAFCRSFLFLTYVYNLYNKTRYKDTWFYCLYEKKGVKSTCIMFFLVEKWCRE